MAIMKELITISIITILMSLNISAMDNIYDDQGINLSTGKFIHQFSKNRSLLKGTNQWIPHQFDIGACKPIVVEHAKMQQPFARRFIQTDQGKLYIPEGQIICEPYGKDILLLKDKKACLSQPYYHDMDNEQSYRNIRWYYNRQYGKKYVTACQPDLSKSFKHIRLIEEFIDDKGDKISTLKEIYFFNRSQKIFIFPPNFNEEDSFSKIILSQQKDHFIKLLPLKEERKTILINSLNKEGNPKYIENYQQWIDEVNNEILHLEKEIKDVK